MEAQRIGLNVELVGEDTKRGEGPEAWYWFSPTRH